MRAEIFPSKLEGVISCPSSKSFAHRALICSAFSSCPVVLKGRLMGDDIESTISALKSIGIDIEKNQFGDYIVFPKAINTEIDEIYVGASGSTLRFMIPILSILGVNCTIKGTDRLSERPIGKLLDTLKDAGCKYIGDKLPLKICGKTNMHTFKVDASISSQYITGILLSLPLIGGGKLITENEIVSKNYIDITFEVMREFGVTVKEQNGIYEVEGRYNREEPYVIESDWSSASFFLVAGSKSDITVNGINCNSTQGDKRVLDAIRDSGGFVELSDDSVVVKSGELKAFDFSIQNCPDLAPILSVLAAISKGKSVILDTERLRIKESDRSKEIVKMLQSFGVEAIELKSSIEIIGGEIKGNYLKLPDDHRICMAAAILASFSKTPVILDGIECVNKSYPEFFEDYRKVGGKVNVSI